MLLLQIKHVSLGLGGGRDNKRTVRDAIRKFSEDPEVRTANFGVKYSENVQAGEVLGGCQVGGVQR
jgi:hypothetical protein